MKRSTSTPNLTRRALLGGLAGGAVLGLLPPPIRAATNGVREFTLRAQKADVNLVGEQFPATAVWCYSGQAPGPVLRARQGERLRIRVDNALDEPTAVHWHGLRIPVDMDGVPGISQAPIAPGQSFTYDFTVPDAGTYWYHSHVSTSEQIGRGLHGALIVDEAQPPPVDRDELWVLDDWRLNREAQIAPFGHGMDISHGGRFGNTLTVNGRLSETFAVRAGERIRLRLVNVANARLFGIHFEGHDPQVIAYDGHPVEPHRPPGGQVLLGPGQRADLILDCTGQPGETYRVIEAAYEGETYQLFAMTYAPDAPVRANPAPLPTLVPNPLSDPDLNAAQRLNVTLDGGAMSGLQGAIYDGERLDVRDLMQRGRMWAINGVAAHTTAMPPLFTLKRGGSYVVAIENNTVFPHPMHLHGHAFRILARDGQSVPHQPWADTVLLNPRGTAEIAFVADNPGDWLFHCHVLEHVSGGMTSVFRVT